MKSIIPILQIALQLIPKARLLGLVVIFLGTSPLIAQPVALVNDITITKLLGTSPNFVRIDKHPVTNEIFIMNDQGQIFQVNPSTKQVNLVFTSSDHGLNETFGLEIGATGNFYVAEAKNEGGYNIGKVAKGVPDGAGGYTWSLLAETQAYQHSGNRDHKFSAIIESKDGQYVYVNSGSRTDHAE
ncbi:MAG: hypothetical protein KDD63_03930, partial [Bacteroidetes bacterium]|nr:hypothetical protein [Bacteroidota bacterium]